MATRRRGAGRPLTAPLAVALLMGAVLLSGCASEQIGDQLPSAIGLPANTPERPAVAYEYPAVHDVPPARSTRPMDEQDQVKVEKELAAIRDQQEAGQEAVKSKKAVTAAKKKKRPPANTAEAAGVKTNP